MADIIHCTAVREQPAFNEVGADTVHVTLSFDQQAPANDAAAEARFRAFLEAVPDARFQLYEVGSGTLKLHPVKRPDGTWWQHALGDRPTGLAEPLIGWLKERRAAWSSPAGGPSDYRLLSAQQLLASSETWDAPVPQQAGLSRILRLEGLEEGKEYTILPFFSDTDRQEILPYTVSDNGCFAVAYDADGGFDAVTALLSGGEEEPTEQGKPLRRRGSIGPMPDDGSLLVNGTTGFLESSEGAGEALETLRRVRERGASLLWTAPQLLDLPSSAFDDAPEETIAERLRWRTMAGLLTLLDPVIATLSMSTPDQEGPFVAKLNAAIEEVVGDRGIKGVAKAMTETVHEAFKQPGTLELEGRRVLAVRLARLFGFAGKLAVRTEPVGGARDPLLIEELDAIPDLVPLMLSLYVVTGAGSMDSELVPPEIGTEAGTARRPWADDLDRQLDHELGDFAAWLGSESGVEALVLNLLDAVGIDPNWIEEETGISLEQAQRAHGAFRLALADEFNGLNALSNAQGQLFQHFLTRSLVETAQARAPSGEKPAPWSNNDLKEALTGANWFARRLDLVVGGAFDRLTEPLPIFPPPQDNWTKEIACELRGRYAEAGAELLGRMEEPRRTVPDTFPRPISVQLAVDDDTAGGALFSQAYNGVALLVRRDEGRWAYANLARLSGDRIDAVTIHPLQPAEVDGQRQLSLGYHGAPLASNGHEPAPEDEATREELAPFYHHDALAPGTFGTYAPLPALGYGHAYDVAAFVVASSGALPDGIRAAEDEPWLPKADPTVPDGAHIHKSIYLRTTAIGQVSLEEADAVGGVRAPFDQAAPGVVPLFRDYPRIAHAAAPGEATTFDLWRNSDGTGALEAPTDADAKLTAEISDIWGWHGAGTLTLNLYAGPRTGGVNPLCAWTIRILQPFANGKLSLVIEKTAGGLRASLEEGAVDYWSIDGVKDAKLPTMSEGLWLRCALASNSDAALTLSFAVPAAPESQGTSANHDKSGLLLLAPSDEDAFWNAGVARSAALSVTYPRMGFQDFDRWLSSRKLFPKLGEPLSDLLAGLIGAVAQPPSDEWEEKLLVELLNRLPDLAVSGLLLELLPVDGLSGDPVALVGEAGRTPRFATIKMPDLKKVVGGASSPAEWLAKIKAEYSRTYEVRCEGATLEIKGGTILVPPGTVAQLRIRPLVPKSYFEGRAEHVFAAWMADWAVGERGDCYVFGGPTLTIETMQRFDPEISENGDPLWPRLVEAMIEVIPAGVDRRYDLTVKEREPAALDWRWRQLGSIDVQTQRWRFMGRPIYRWFNPKDEEHPLSGQVAGCPVVRLRPSDAVKAFEKEAFLDRDPQESDTQTALLRAQPSITTLQSFPWEEPSATLFRHRLVLRSRYAGAIASSGKREVEVTQDGNQIHWWRVAMLADRSRLQLTRPQLRALMPLPVSPETSGTPPVLAMLEENPFVHGGLADRIGAEVKTGFGYELPSEGSLKILDSRKEIGPDTRLSYHPVSKADALAVALAVEGPIGLTFDSVSAPAPLYVNSALILTPLLLRPDGEERRFDEHFISVSLRRYLDHRWTVEEKRMDDATELPANEPWWIEFDASATISCADVGGASTLICELVRDPDWSVRVAREAIMSGVGADAIEVATARAEKASRMCLLHQPLDEGRGALSVFLRSGDEQAGDDGPAPQSPVMLASYEWSIPALPAADRNEVPTKPAADRILIKGKGTAWPTSASPATSMNWTRTAANADLLHVQAANGKELETLRVAGLTLVASTGAGKAHLVRTGSTDPLWVRPALSAYPNPLYVHRHLAAIYTTEVRRVGRSESFVEAWMLCGAELPAPDTLPYDKARIVEIEVPALPVASGTQLPGFDTACFDVLALMGEGKEQLTDRKGLMFWLRPVTKLQLGLGTKLGLSVRCTSTAEPKTQELLISAAEAIDVRFILLRLNQSPAPSAAAIDRAGVVHPLSFDKGEELRLPPLDSLTTLELMALTIGGEGALQSEFWADVSMLPVSDEPADIGRMRLPFEALFTGTDASAAEAVSPSRLRSQAEAGARIVSCSEPIPVSPWAS